MFTLRNVILFVIFWCTIASSYLILRWRALRKGFKRSEYEDFLDFFEFEFLKRTKPTWRRKFSNLYNKKGYWFLLGFALFLLLFTAIMGVTIIVRLYANGVEDVLDILI